MPNLKRNTAVVIGRFQLPHLAHLHLLRAALHCADQVVVVVGSAWRSRNPHNPFTVPERCAMLRAALTPAEAARIHFEGVRDVNDDARWRKLVRQAVGGHTELDESVTLVGHRKDASSYYVHSFPEFGLVEVSSPLAVSSTDLRKAFFEAEAPGDWSKALAPFVAPGVLDWLSRWSHTAEFRACRDEHLAVKAYKQTYPGPVYRTGDAIVEAAGHVLMIERNGVIGHGLFAWPGGHQDPGETGLETALRELAEETTLPLSAQELRNCLVAQAEFDAPGRSPRGRIITTACHFRLPGFTPETLPEVFGRDDAKPKHALWLTREAFADRMHLMFDDHDLIGERFLGEMVPSVSLI